MRAKAEVQAHKAVDITLTITATVEEWERVAKMLADIQTWPASPFSRIISTCLRDTVKAVSTVSEEVNQ